MKNSNLKLARRMKARGWRWMRGSYKNYSGIRKAYLPHAKAVWKINNRHLKRK